MFRLTLSQGIYHNHRLDSSYDGRYLLRLPDFTLVYAEDYARRRAELDGQPGQESTSESAGDEGD